MCRHAVQEACDLILGLSVQSVGVSGVLAPHPLERLVRDLTTYLRQPAADAALVSVGERVLEAELPGVVAESHDVGVQIGADRDPTRNKDLLQRINELRPISPAIKVIMGRYFPGKGGGRLATT